MISLEKLHATKRAATWMLDQIVDKITRTEWMLETAKRAGIDPDKMYEVVKAGSKWRIKATQAHLTATQQLHKIHNQRGV
jgi:hypothetical protein